jgi:hypothetical protein
VTCFETHDGVEIEHPYLILAMQQTAEGGSIMKASYVPKKSLIGLVILTLLMMNAGMLAQTRTRPKVVNSDPATYRYAYQHGYRGGYEDGFTKGKSDFNENQPRDFGDSEAFKSADRGYSERMGTRAEYQEGYRIGFALGYGDGYYGRPYSISLPTNLGKSVITVVNQAGGGDVASASDPPRANEERIPADDIRKQETRPAASSSRGSLYIRDGVQMKIRLTTQLDTRTNREGDRFTAIVLDPSEYADAVIEGHIAKLNRSGKATGKTEIALAFDSIRLRDGRSGRLAAQVERVYQTESVKTVDEEGNVQTGSRTTDTATRGAAIGAGVGAGSVFVQGGKELVLEPGTEILIRTAAPARSEN